VAVRCLCFVLVVVFLMTWDDHVACMRCIRARAGDWDMAYILFYRAKE